MFLERGLEVDHSTLNRWVLAYAPLIERRLRAFRKPHCGSVRIDETYIKIRGQWRYLYRAIDKHGTPVDFLLTATARSGRGQALLRKCYIFFFFFFFFYPVDFLLTAKRDLEAAKRFFRKMLEDQPLLAPDRIGTDAAGPYPPAIAAARKAGLLRAHAAPLRHQAPAAGDRERPLPGEEEHAADRRLSVVHTARRTIQGFEAMLWLRKGFGFAGAWTVCEQNRLLAVCFGLPAG